MSVTNHLESVWIGSGGMVMYDYMARVNNLAIIDYGAVLGLTVTGLGLVIAKGIELWKNWKLANTVTNQDMITKLQDNHDKQLLAQQEGYEVLLAIDQKIIQHLKDEIAKTSGT